MEFPKVRTFSTFSTDTETLLSSTLYFESTSSFMLLSSGHSRHTTAMETSSMTDASERAMRRSMSLPHWSPPSRAKHEAVRQKRT